MRSVSKPRSDPSLNLHDSGVAVDKVESAGGIGAAGRSHVGGSGSIVIHNGGASSSGGSNGRRYRKRSYHNRRRLLPQTATPKSGSSSTSNQSSSGEHSSDEDIGHAGTGGIGGRCNHRCYPLAGESDDNPCLDFRWLVSISLVCLAVCLCAGLLCLHLSASARLADVTLRCLSANHQLAGLAEEMQALHSQLAACRGNSTRLAEAAGRLRRSVRGLRVRVAELYAGRAGLAQVGPLREKVRKLVQDSADRGAAIARLEQSVREILTRLAKLKPPA